MSFFASHPDKFAKGFGNMIIYSFFQQLVSRRQAFLIAAVFDVFSGVLTLSRKDGY